MLRCVTPDAAAAAAKHLSQCVHAVAGKVPGIIDITFGPTFTTDRNQGFTHALVVDLADKAALEVSPISSFVLLPLSNLLCSRTTSRSKLLGSLQA